MSKIPTRVTFVDYDGVLNDPDYLLKTSRQLDPQRIAYLQKLCTDTGAKVVLTSVWRHNELAKTTLKRAGVPLIGSTPQTTSTQEGLSDRETAIDQWIKDKHFTGEYIILDDTNDYSSDKQARLICTREDKTLGLQPKHIKYALALFNDLSAHFASNLDIIAVLERIESELSRVMWNIRQKSYDNDNPFRNTGNVKGFSNNTFEVHAYDWGWDYEDSNRPQPFNFRWRDIQICWYKHCGRGITVNRQITLAELSQLLKECTGSLQEMDNLYD